MQPIEACKQLGLLSVAILVVGLAFLALKWPQGVDATFSQHAAAQKKTVVYYIILFLVALPILSMFFIFWFVPTFHLSVWFIAFVILSELLQHSVTFIPEVGGWKTRWHILLTNYSAVLLAPALLIVALSSHISRASITIAVISLGIMLAITAYFQILKLSNKLKHLMLLQSSYYGAFFLAILAVTYLK